MIVREKCVCVSKAFLHEWPLSEFSGNLWEQAIRSHTLPLGLVHIHTDAHPPFPFPSTQTQPRIPLWTHHSRVELRDETATLFNSLQYLPRHVQHSNTHFISHSKLSVAPPSPSLSLSFPAFCLPIHPFSSRSPPPPPFPSPLQQWRMMTSTPFHLTSCKTHAESHWMGTISARKPG